MSIKRIVRLSFIVITLMILIIFGINIISLKKIEQNNIEKDNISHLISMQENMHQFISDSMSVDDVFELEAIKTKFKKEGNDFDNIKDRYINKTNDNVFGLLIKKIYTYDNVKKEIETLLKNKNQLKYFFERSYNLKKEMLLVKESFFKLYPKERSIRKKLEELVLSTNNIDLIKTFGDMKYLSKEALFQHKSKKYFKKWKSSAKLLKDKTKLKLFNDYIIVIDSLKLKILATNQYENEKILLYKQIKKIFETNKTLNKNINQYTQFILNDFIDFCNYILLILIVLILSSVFLLEYKVYKSVNVSVNKIKTKIDNALVELRKKDELLAQQAKQAAMGEMIGNIAHQWRQPLNALAGNIQFLREDYEDGVVDEKFIENYIVENMTTINFMSKTIDDFRDFFKSNKLKEKFKIFDCISKPLNLLKPQLEELGIEINLSGCDFILNEIEGELHQVILNILNNSKDALVENRVRNPKIQLETRTDNNIGVIVIQDNAGGIPDDIIDRIFEPYYTTKEQGKGTGIGLYMSKTIITNNMNGELKAYNKNEGACFEIRLNLA